VALVGLDATPSPGLRGPTNFAGWLTAEQIAQLEAELASLRYAPLTSMSSVSKLLYRGAGISSIVLHLAAVLLRGCMRGKAETHNGAKHCGCRMAFLRLQARHVKHLYR